ncbi:MAG: hypothetical protein M3680_00655 [Myxococcota bacterium]|nr:hypothetical protein [Myxococcota bacterium]
MITIAARPRTLVLTVTAAEIEAVVLDPAGVTVGGRVRVPRAADAVPDLQALGPQLDPLGEFDRITVSTGPGLGAAWDATALTRELERQSLRPVRVVPTAELRYRGVIRREGVELVLALGAALESWLFVDGTHVPGLALGAHPFRKGKTYAEYLAPRVVERKGRRAWNRRLERVLATVLEVWHPATLYLAGAGAALVDGELPATVVVVRELPGLDAAIAVWHPPPS